MAELFREWAMVLSGIAVFGSLSEVIFPEGSLQKYLRLGIGMILVIALLAPVQGLLQGEWKGSVDFEREDAYRRRESMEPKQKEAVLRIYTENLSRKILASLQEGMPGFSGEVQCEVSEEEETFGAIQEVQVISDTEGVKEEQMTKILQEEFGLRKEQVTVRLWGEKNP